MAQLRENNVSVWRDNFMRDLQAVERASPSGGESGRGEHRTQAAAENGDRSEDGSGHSSAKGATPLRLRVVPGGRKRRDEAAS
jgi:hypothetical protein